MIKSRFKKSLLTPVIASCLLVPLAPSASADVCEETGMDIMFSILGEAIGLLPIKDKAAAALNILGFTTEKYLCDYLNPTVEQVEEIIEEKLKEFKRGLDKEKFATGMDELERRLSTLETHVATSDSINELDDAFRRTDDLEQDAMFLGLQDGGQIVFEGTELVLGLADIKLALLMHQYYLSSNRDEIADSVKEMQEFMKETIGRLNDLETALEQYLNNKIVVTEVFTWNDGTFLRADNFITNESIEHVIDYTSHTEAKARIWAREQKNQYRSKILTSNYQKNKNRIALYASKNLEDLHPLHLTAWNPQNSSTTSLFLAGAKGDVHIADLAGNGKNDLFASVNGEWHRNLNVNGAWKRINFNNREVKELRFGDFDKDGTTDVFYSGSNGWLVSYKGGRQSWTLINSKANIGTVKTTDLFVADFDGDGKPDVFHGTGSNWRISSGGTKSWKTINSSATKVKDLLFGDFNGDGKMDVFHSRNDQWYVSYAGRSSWQLLNYYHENVKDLIIGDFNGDGKADVLNANGSNWLISYSGTSSYEVTRGSMSVTKEQITVGDIDNDGVTEILWSPKK